MMKGGVGMGGGSGGEGAANGRSTANVRVRVMNISIRGVWVRGEIFIDMNMGGGEGSANEDSTGLLSPYSL